MGTKDRLADVLEDVKFKSSLLAGVSAPMNYFDPLGFSTTVDAGKLLFYREVELKHGRIAMLAALGILVGEQYHPLFGGDIDVPAYVAFQQTPLEKFWLAVVGQLPSLRPSQFKHSKTLMREGPKVGGGKSRQTMYQE